MDHDHRPRASLAMLALRARVARRIREFFDTRGFLEVETPILSRDTVVDRHLDPMVVTPPGEALPRFLQTSPEFAMKRLLAAGAGPIYQIAKVFRAEERGPLHNPEFTMVEWYRPGDDPPRGMQLLAELAETLFECGPTRRVPYAEAFERATGVHPWRCSTEALRDAARRLGVSTPASLGLDDRDTWLDLLMAERVQPGLGQTTPTIVYDYPATQAALARVRDGEPPVAERFELFFRGMELANGYHELTDPDVLRRRNRENNAWRERDGKPRLPETSRLLDAMDLGLPPSSGVALGFDRVVMLIAGATTIDEVLAFPYDRA